MLLQVYRCAEHGHMCWSTPKHSHLFGEGNKLCPEILQAGLVSAFRSLLVLDWLRDAPVVCAERGENDDWICIQPMSVLD
jgi:hypothetical protein